MAGSYLLLGPEEGEKNDKIREIKSSIGDDYESYKFYPFEMDNDELNSALNNGSLFSPYRVVTIGQIELLNEKQSRIIIDYLENPNDETTLLLTSSEPNVARLSSGLSRISKILDKSKFVFYEMYDSKKPDWVRNYFRKFNLQITPEAVTLLLELVENNTQELKSACSQLSLFFNSNNGRTIREEDIEQYIHHSRKESAFTLFEAMAKGQMKESVGIMRVLAGGNDSDPITLIAGLTWSFRRLTSVSELISSGFSKDEAFAKATVMGKASPLRIFTDKNIYSAALSRYTTDDLHRILQVLGEYDMLVRTEAGDMQLILLEKMLHVIIVDRGCSTPQVSFG